MRDVATAQTMTRAQLAERTAHLPPYRLTCGEFKALLEYSASVPTALPLGKTWKSQDRFGRWVIHKVTQSNPGENGVIISAFRPVVRP